MTLPKTGKPPKGRTVSSRMETMADEYQYFDDPHRRAFVDGWKGRDEWLSVRFFIVAFAFFFLGVFFGVVSVMSGIPN